MNLPPPYTVKIATEDWELELVHQLNYQTFVEEIPQHHTSSSHRLVDKFHAENIYIICLHGTEIAGMITIRGQRPFSLDLKVPNLDMHLPAGRTPCEIRLLAVARKYRNGPVFYSLVEFLAQYGKAQGFDLALISGTTRQLKLYRHLGFKAFGPLVGQGDALFQPMYLTLEEFEERNKGILASASSGDSTPAGFLPGPVAVHPSVKEAFGQFPISHRSEEFHLDLRVTKQWLLHLTGAHQVEILLGSGTLANDVVAGQLSLLRQPGLILSNGEFGTRLIDHATRFRLAFDTVEREWGLPFDGAEIERQLDRNPSLQWLWAVHCESSTGVLNDLSLLKPICEKRQLKLCLDCISSIGTIPLDLKEIYLASGVSGKGLAGFPGLSLVFYDHAVEPAPKDLPRYLDLGYYAACEGVPFTHSSNLLVALQTALRQSGERRYQKLRETATWLRQELRAAGLRVLADEADASPAIVTLVLPTGMSSRIIGKKLEKAGYLLSYGSKYLLDRNWIQICLMGEFSQGTLADLVQELKNLLPAQTAGGSQEIPAVAVGE